MKPMPTSTPTKAQSPQGSTRLPWMGFPKNESRRSSPDSKTEPTGFNPHGGPTSSRKTARNDHWVSLLGMTSSFKKSSGSFWNASMNQSLRTVHMDFVPGRSPHTALEQIGNQWTSGQVDRRHGHAELLHHHPS